MRGRRTGVSGDGPGAAYGHVGGREGGRVSGRLLAVGGRDVPERGIGSGGA